MIFRGRFALLWLATMFLFGLSIMTSYVFVQQEGRSSINIPLLQIAQSVETDLKSGVLPAEILKGRQIDLSVNQSPFVTLYGLDKKVIGSSEHLRGKTLALPVGVLNNAKAKGKVTLTWQPTPDLRFASVTDFVPDFGFVSVSQSLQETEARATRGMWIALIALGLGSISSGFAFFLFVRMRPNKAL